MKKILLFALALSLLLAYPVCAYTTELSYGISVLRKDVTLKKCGVSGEVLAFTASDFENAMGTDRLSALCICTLPDKMLGSLTLGGSPVYSGQIIEREDIGELCFVPSGNGEYSVSFDFSDAKASSATYACTVNLVKGGNSAPVASDAKYSTQSGIELIKTLSAYDPEGDTLEYRLTASSSKGKLRFLDSKTGKFSYLPSSDTTGKDSFRYTVCDKYGNESDEVTVTIVVEKPACDVFYADMNGNPAHNSAIKLAAAGLMTGESIGGVNYFYPEETVTRATFLRLCMQANGLSEAAVEVSVTAFADDNIIASYDKPYVNLAHESGIISGIVTENGTVFSPDTTISIAEAVTVLSRIVGKSSAVALVYAEESSGHWANEAYCNLLSQGYIEPCSELDVPLTRELAAQMLCNCIE